MWDNKKLKTILKFSDTEKCSIKICSERGRLFTKEGGYSREVPNKPMYTINIQPL